jgi:hypothetical protein
LKCFERPYKIRRFGSDEEINGYAAPPGFHEFIALFDAQINVPPAKETLAEGARLSKPLRTWGTERRKATDAATGEQGDRLLYDDGCWYECVSCEYRNHTVLRHWRGEWKRAAEGRTNHP